MLFQWIRELNFVVTLSALFGTAIEQEDNSLIKAFHQFDGWFELASSNIPHIFLPKFTKAKARLLKCAQKLVLLYPEEPEHSPPLTAELMRKELGKDGLENWLLAMIWAGEANTIPTLFWTIYYLVDHPRYLQRTEEEIAQTLNGRDLSELSFKDIMSISTLKNALNETIRLHSPPIIVRGARQPVKVKDYTVPQGHFLCLSPFWIQRDDAIFDNATAWNPDRWNYDKSMKEKPFLAFGQGKYRCPGQSFAYAGMMLALCNVFSLYRFEFPSQFQPPEIDMNNLVGMTKPLHDISVQIYTK